MPRNTLLHLSLINVNISPNDVLLFDMDGTLIHTDNANNIAYKLAIRDVLGEIPDDLFNNIYRIRQVDVRNAIKNISEEQFNQIVTYKNEYYKKNLSATYLIDNVVDLLKLHHKTHKCILVSDACCDRVMQTLEYFNLKNKFYGIITKEDCIDNKNKFTSAISKFKLDPDELWVFEDEQENIDKALKLNVKHFILKDNETFYYLSK